MTSHTSWKLWGRYRGGEKKGHKKTCENAIKLGQLENRNKHL